MEGQLNGILKTNCLSKNKLSEEEEQIISDDSSSLQSVGAVVQEEAPSSVSFQVPTEKSCDFYVVSDDDEMKTNRRTSGLTSRAIASMITDTSAYHHRSTSMTLRRMPTEVLLLGDAKAADLEILGQDERSEVSQTTGNGARKVSPWICLNPKFELRTQLWFSFGSLSWIAIIVVVLTCVISSILVGENTKESFGELVETLAKEQQGLHIRYLSEAFGERLIPADLAEIMLQATLDRAGNYTTPDGPILPLEWDSKNQPSLVDEANYAELVQTRQDKYKGVPVSTAAPMFQLQGGCDPDDADESSPTYFPGCTDANNNLTTGGIVAPSDSTLRLYNWSRKLAPILKALHEYNQDIRDLGVYWFNNGAGASTNYPAFAMNGSNSYESVGCDWMRQPNPYDPIRSIATDEQIAACRPEGERVYSRVYNPMERGWCRDQALNPERIMIDGPFLDAFLSEQWLLTVGRAVYDRESNDFLACVYVGLNAEFLEEILREAKIYPFSELSVVVASTGKVVASSKWNISEDGPPPPITELDVGVTNHSLHRFANLVDYAGSTEWDADEVRSLYLDSYEDLDGYRVTFFPFPSVPDKYDASYRPEHLAILSTPLEDLLRATYEANVKVDDTVKGVVWYSVLVGACTLIFFSLILIFMSRSLTKPLVYINKTSQSIVQAFGDTSPDAKDFVKEPEESAPSTKVFPMKSMKSTLNPGRGKLVTTEVTELANEFDKIVVSFAGGSLMPQEAKAQRVEVYNMFPMKSKFVSLYKSRDDTEGPAFARGTAKDAEVENINLGSNIGEAQLNFDEPERAKSFDMAYGNDNRCASRLCLWILVLLVLPLLSTMLIISAVSMATLVRDFKDVTAELEDDMLDVELRKLDVSTSLRREYASIQLSRSIRDLYIVNRVGGWLLFGGLNATDTFPSFQNIIEACKMYDNISECPDAVAFEVCDCAWGFDSGMTCQEYPGGSRHLQLPFLQVQSDMALPNGTRKTTAFPNISYSPSTTLWWKTDELPNEHRNASSIREHQPLYETSRDRARLVGVAIHALFAISNYKRRSENAIDYFFSFEEDGLYTGWEGCTSHLHSQGINFESTKDNGAADLRPELCPLGRFGYDPRCRDWYDTARRRADTSGVSLHVTAPYIFAYDYFVIGQTSVGSLVDPVTGNFVGHSAVDILIDLILQVLSSRRTRVQFDGFSVLITPTNNNFGADVVFGPGFHPHSSTSIPVAELLIPIDVKCAKDGDIKCIGRKETFDGIVREMKNCKTGSSSFLRLTDSKTTEKLYISYAPVETGFLDPVNASRFEEGATLSKHCVYSLAFLETEAGLHVPFNQVEDDIERQIRIASLCLAVVIALAFLVTSLVSYYIVRSISQAMVALLEAVRLLQTRLGEDDKFPTFDRTRGSKEVVRVSSSLESLFEVVRFANLAYYAGETEMSYRVLRDSLRIFQKMGNKKAVGVASNNLGNVLLSMYLDMEHEGLQSMCGLTRQQLIDRGTAYFHNAIKLGEAAYDSFYAAEGWTPNCLDFMQHLSNRYFNRGMFLLTVKDDHDQPAEIEKLGMRDLQIARDFDAEIVEYGKDVGWGRHNRAQKLFDVSLTRICGLLALNELGYSDDEWDIGDMLEQLFKMLELESTKTVPSDLFVEVSYIGRLQEIEVRVMQYLMAETKIEDAAKVAIRPLFEDEYLFGEMNATALHVLNTYVSQNAGQWDKSVLSALQRSLEDTTEATSVSRSSELNSLSGDFVSLMRKSMKMSDETSFSSSRKNLSVCPFTRNDRQYVAMEVF